MRTILPLLLLLLVSCVDVAADPSSGALVSGDGSVPVPFPSVTDFAARGPFETMNEESDAECIIFRPAVLGELGRLHPVIVWGNGTLGFPAVYTGLLDHWASHGFVVAAAKTSNAGTGEEMIACLDWVLAQNELEASAYRGHVAADRIGVSGHSQGGGGAIMAGRDPRVTTTAPLMPYTLGLGHDPSSQSQQHGPMFLLSGGTDFIAVPLLNQKPVYESANVPVIWGTLLTAGHTAALLDGGRFRGPMTTWFRWRLMSDASAGDDFEGSVCGLCTNPSWKVRQRP